MKEHKEREHKGCRSIETHHQFNWDETNIRRTCLIESAIIQPKYQPLSNPCIELKPAIA